MSQTALLFLMFFVVMVSLAVARNPIYGVMAYVALVFIDPPSRWWGYALPDMRWSLLACVATVIGMAVHKPRRPEVPFARHPIVVLLVLLGVAIYFLLQPATPTDRIRDIFIIVVALESLVIGVALIVLIVQLASLINLLQNEVRPILNATNETVNNLRGTVEFLGENAVEPVIKLNGYLAGMNRVIELMGIKKK